MIYFYFILSFLAVLFMLFFPAFLGVTKVTFTINQLTLLNSVSILAGITFGTYITVILTNKIKG